MGMQGSGFRAQVFRFSGFQVQAWWGLQLRWQPRPATSSRQAPPILALAGSLSLLPLFPHLHLAGVVGLEGRGEPVGEPLVVPLHAHILAAGIVLQAASAVYCQLTANWQLAAPFLYTLPLHPPPVSGFTHSRLAGLVALE